MARYQDELMIRRTSSGKRYYGTVKPADIITQLFDTQYVAKLGDRWDTLAYKFYGSAALWYVLANANGYLDGSIYVEPGTILIIPGM